MAKSAWGACSNKLDSAHQPASSWHTSATGQEAGSSSRTGPESRGVHQLWFTDGKTIHMSAGAPDFRPTNPKDDQFYVIVDLRDPKHPHEVGRWWLPGQQVGDNAAPPKRHPGANDSGFRPHNTNVYPERPDR